MDWKAVLGVVATVIALLSYIPYLKDVARRSTKPHAFSWLVWALLTAVGFAGQLSEGAGAGAWVTGVTAGACFVIFIAALFRGEKNITGFDWGCLVLSLGSIPLWIITDSPFFSVILITIIDFLGFLPTFRKAYARPYEETLAPYLIGAVKFLFGVIALDTISIVTALYPLSLVVANGAFVVMVCHRRTRLGKIY